MTEFVVRRVLTFRSEEREREGRVADVPLVKAAIAVVLNNPFAGRYVEDLSEAQDYSVGLGTMVGGLAAEALGEPVLSYGKAAMAGLGGTQEHAVMYITTPFGDALRAAIGGGKAWIPSATCVASAGSALTVPLAHKDALYVRDHYDAMTIHAPTDAPRPDEVLVAVAVANRGRLDARLGGIPADEVQGQDGLR